MNGEITNEIQDTDIVTRIKNDIELSINRINEAHGTSESEWEISLEEAVFYHLKCEEPTLNSAFTSYAEYQKNTSNDDYATTSFQSQYRTCRSQLERIFDLFSLPLELIFNKASQYKINSQQYRFIHELLSRYRHISSVWSKIAKEHHYSYEGFLDLYYKIDYKKRADLVNELRFIIEGLIAVHDRSVMSHEIFSKHIMAVSQIHLIMNSESIRNIALIDIDDLSTHPKALTILESYHDHILNTSLALKAVLIGSKQKWEHTYNSKFHHDHFVYQNNHENSSESNDEEQSKYETFFDKMLEAIKSADLRYENASSLDGFLKIDDITKEQQTTTQNKNLDKKIFNALRDSFTFLSDEDDLTLQLLLDEIFQL